MAMSPKQSDEYPCINPFFNRDTQYVEENEELAIEIYKRVFEYNKLPDEYREFKM